MRYQVSLLFEADMQLKGAPSQSTLIASMCAGMGGDLDDKDTLCFSMQCTDEPSKAWMLPARVGGRDGA